MTLTQVYLAAMLMTGLWICPALAGPYNSLIVFGDSLSDTGNVLIASRGTIPGSPSLPRPLFKWPELS